LSPFFFMASVSSATVWYGLLASTTSMKGWRLMVAATRISRTTSTGGFLNRLWFAATAVPACT
jgi:hypothetical protein